MLENAYDDTYNLKIEILYVSGYRAMDQFELT